MGRCFVSNKRKEYHYSFFFNTLHIISLAVFFRFSLVSFCIMPWKMTSIQPGEPAFHRKGKNSFSPIKVYTAMGISCLAERENAPSLKGSNITRSSSGTPPSGKITKLCPAFIFSAAFVYTSARLFELFRSTKIHILRYINPKIGIFASSALPIKQMG